MGSISTLATVLAPSAIAHEGVDSSDTDSSSLIYQEGGSTPTHARGNVPCSLSAPVTAPCQASFAATPAPLPGAETRRPSLQARQLPAPVACDLRLNRHIQHIPAAPTSPTAHKEKSGPPLVAQLDSPPADSGLAGSSNAAGESEVGQPATVCDEAEEFDFHFDFTGAVEEEGADPTLRLATFDSVDESDLGAGGSSVDSASEMLPSKPHPPAVTNRRRTLIHSRSPSMPGCALSPLLPTFSNQTAGHEMTLQLPPSRRSLSATHLIPLQDELPSLEPNLPERDHRWGSRAVETWLSEGGWRNDPSTAVLPGPPTSEAQQPQTLLPPTVGKPVPIFLPLES
ncbi:hypothetical protein SprV_0902747700 [Sparganum proliferum]